MDLKERLQRGLQHARRFTNGVIKELDSPQDWIQRPVANANHALWIVGHLAYADNSFTRWAAPERTDTRPEYKQLFGMGSTPSDRLEDYPSIDEVTQYLAARRVALLAALDSLADADFDRATPEQAPPFLYDLGSVFQMAAWHEALHAGQLSVIHRQLGNQPLAGRR